MLTVAISKRNKLQNIIVLTPKDGGTGIDPDVEVEYEYNEEDPVADNQLEKAIEIVKGNGM